MGVLDLPLSFDEAERMRLPTFVKICLMIAGLLASYQTSAHAQFGSNPLANFKVEVIGSPGAMLFDFDALSEYATPPFLLRIAAKSMFDQIRLLDVRPRAEYDAGHVPKAVWVDEKKAREIAARPGGLSDVEAWVEWSKPLGLTPDTIVLVMDGNRQLEAARVWWLLRYLGVEHAGLIDGNFGLWEIQRRPITRDVPDIAPNPFPVDFAAPRLATRADMLTSLRDRSAKIIDARSLEEWLGQNYTAKRGGHMPGACRLEWLDFVDKYGRFPGKKKVEAKLAAAGMTPGEPVITHCQSGGRASVDAFVFEALGYPTRNYYLSWADWGNADDTPITTDEAPPTQLVVPVAVTPREQPTPEPVQIAVTPDPVPNPTQPNPQPPVKPFTAEYYYKCHWGRSDEFLALFQRNHLPILRERIKQGDILKVSMTKPRIHENESGRWDYRVTIEFRDAASAFDPAADQAIKERLFPDQIQYRKEEQRRFEILDAHWDLPIDAVDLDIPVIAP